SDPASQRRADRIGHGPSLMGLRRSRWAKSTMVAGVLAVVLSYAAPPISAAAAAGSTGTGLPGLDSPSFAFPAFDEPGAKKAAADPVPSGDAASSDASAQAGDAGDTGQASQARGATDERGAPANGQDSQGSARAPASGGSAAA